ncbi:MAG: hypothetical protein ACFNX0_01135 [Treponema sp.]
MSRIIQDIRIARYETFASPYARYSIGAVRDSGFEVRDSIIEKVKSLHSK